MTAVRPFRALAYLLFAAAVSFCAGALCHIISLRNLSGVSSSSAHQFQEKDFDGQDQEVNSLVGEGGEFVNFTSHNVDVSPHLPSGQSLFIDIRHADTAILNSEEWMASAIMELVKETNDVFLYYRCHALQPVGLSCVGVSAKSHVS